MKNPQKIKTIMVFIFLWIGLSLVYEGRVESMEFTAPLQGLPNLGGEKILLVDFSSFKSQTIKESQQKSSASVAVEKALQAYRVFEVSA